MASFCWQGLKAPIKRWPRFWAELGSLVELRAVQHSTDWAISERPWEQYGKDTKHCTEVALNFAINLKVFATNFVISSYWTNSLLVAQYPCIFFSSHTAIVTLRFHKLLLCLLLFIHSPYCVFFSSHTARVYLPFETVIMCLLLFTHSPCCVFFFSHTARVSLLFHTLLL